MSILVKGMEMPKDRPQLLWVYPNGRALPVQSDVDPCKELQAVPVPPHGRLIDADVMKTKMVCSEYWEKVLIEWIDEQKTVIPAEEG